MNIEASLSNGARREVKVPSLTRLPASDSQPVLLVHLKSERIYIKVHHFSKPLYAIQGDLGTLE